MDSTGVAVDTGGLNLKELLLRKARTGSVGSKSETAGAIDIIRNVEADAVVELTPGNPSTGQPGLSHFEAALRSGKHLVTANKITLAMDYPGFMRLARARDLELRYGACTGGGMPLLEFGESCSFAEPVTRIEGVLNATSNFILAEIENRGRSFNDALKEAQRLGYAETDPSLDIDGFDSACKIVIVANHILGTKFTLKDVRPINGIRNISRVRVTEARARGRRIRMIALAERHPEVTVTSVPENDGLAVGGPSNAVKFHCKLSGPRIVSGMAGGGVATSIGVLRDLIRLQRSLTN